MYRSFRPLKILQVNSGDLGGGAESSAWNLFHEYRKRGHMSFLTVGRKSSSDPFVFRIPLSGSDNAFQNLVEPVRVFLEFWRGKITGAGMMRSWLPRLTSRQKMRFWWQGMEDCYGYGSNRLMSLLPEKPDIIHCHNLHGGYFDLQSLVFLSKQMPVILNLRDAWLLSGHCAHPMGCFKWQAGCGNCPDLSIYPKIRRDATHFNWNKKSEIYRQSLLYIVTNSEWMMDQVKQSMLRGLEYRVIENGIDLSIFKSRSKKEVRRELGLSHDISIALFVANNVRKNKWKDYETVKEAISRAAHKYTENKILLLCLGEKGYGENIGSKAEIRFKGFVMDPNQMAKYYQSADIYINAVRAESSGKTVTEALACGIPVVTTAVGGIPEQVRDGLNGFLTPPADSEAMADRILLLLKNEELRKKMGMAALKIAQRFDLNRQAREFLEWYHQIIDSRKSLSFHS